MELFQKYRVRNHVILWVATVLILAWRIPNCWRDSIFIAEDAWVFFADAYNKPWTVSLLTPYAGYFHLLPRILAEVFSILPIVLQPYVYGMVSLAIDAFLITVFYFPHFETLIRSNRVRAGVIVLMALAGNAENLGMLDGINWYVSFAMAMMLVMNPPEGRVGRIAMYALAFLTIWSTPAVIVLFPFFIFRCKYGSTPFIRRWSLFACINQIPVVFFVVWMRIGSTGGTEKILLSELPVALERLVLRGWFGCGLLGEWLTIKIIHFQPVFLDIWSTFWLLFIVWIVLRFRHNTSVRRIAVLLLISLLMIFLSLTRSEYISELGKTILSRHPRYLTVPTLLTIIGLWGIAYNLWGNSRPRLLCLFGLIQLLFLLVGAPNSWHPSRPDFPKASGVFKLKDYVAAIRSFEDEYRETGEPATLYVPMDVIFWGPVLKKGGGYEYLAPLPLADGLGCKPDEEGNCDSWLGKFRQIPDSQMIEHERLGLLEFLGIWDGRVWFRDAQDRTVMTS